MRVFGNAHVNFCEEFVRKKGSHRGKQSACLQSSENGTDVWNCRRQNLSLLEDAVPKASLFLLVIPWLVEPGGDNMLLR